MGMDRSYINKIKSLWDVRHKMKPHESSPPDPENPDKKKRLGGFIQSMMYYLNEDWDLSEKQRRWVDKLVKDYLVDKEDSRVTDTEMNFGVIRALKDEEKGWLIYIEGTGIPPHTSSIEARIVCEWLEGALEHLKHGIGVGEQEDF